MPRGCPIQHTYTDDDISRTIRRFGIDTSHFETGYGRKGQKGHPKDPTLVLVIKPAGSARTPTATLRRALFTLGVPEMCTLCGSPPTWLEHPLRLVIDHINGDWLDNRLENLRILCPNCHSQTPTFCRYVSRPAS